MSLEIHFVLVSATLGEYKIGPDPDGLDMVRIYSKTDNCAIQMDFSDIPDLILALQKLQEWKTKNG